jgi:hypothetical protein
VDPAEPDLLQPPRGWCASPGRPHAREPEIPPPLVQGHEPENLIHHGPPAKIAEDLERYREAGIDELIVFLEIPDLRQLDLFARARELANLSG